MTDTSRIRDDRLIWQRFRFHSRTFSLAALFLPRAVRTPVATLYMFCRSVDQIADRLVLDKGHTEALAALESTQHALDDTLRDQPPNDLLWLRLLEVHREFGLAEQPMNELIQGARWDLEGRAIHNEDDLVSYSNLVGGSIGVMMLPLLGLEQGGDIEKRARNLGIGMQITNILRDVGEDLRVLSRSYLPTTLCSRYNVDPAEPVAHSASYRALMEYLMSLAERYYESGLLGIGALPASMRPGIGAATRLYRQILNELRRNDYDNLARRAYVPWSRKAMCLLRDDYYGRKRRFTDRDL